MFVIDFECCCIESVEEERAKEESPIAKDGLVHFLTAKT